MQNPLLPTSHICNMHLLICPCQVPVFQDTETAFLRHLSLTAQPLIFLPGEYIVRKGDIGYGLFLIYSGKVSTEPHFVHHVPGSYHQFTLYMCVFCALGGSFRWFWFSAGYPWRRSIHRPAHAGVQWIPHHFHAGFHTCGCVPSRAVRLWESGGAPPLCWGADPLHCWGAIPNPCEEGATTIRGGAVIITQDYNTMNIQES